MKTIASKAPARMPFSYRQLRMLGLLAMTIGQASMILKFCHSVYTYLGMASPYVSWIGLINAGEAIGHLTIPLLIISAMSVMLRSTRAIVRVLILNILGAVILSVIYICIYAFVLMCVTPDVVRAALPDMWALGVKIIRAPGFPELLGRVAAEKPAAIIMAAANAIKQLPEHMLTLEGFTTFISAHVSDAWLEPIVDLITTALPGLFYNFVSKNIFLDVTLCASVYWFVISKPERMKGGKLMIFRMGAVLPIGYALAGFVLNSAIKMKWITPSPLMVLLLPTHAIGNYVIFVGMIMFRKYQELEFYAHGGQKEDLDGYLSSPRGAYQMSRFLAALLLFTGVCDLLLSKIPGITAWGIGSCYWMILGAPVVMLYNFTTIPKHKWIDNVYIPVYYILSFILIAYISGEAFDNMLEAIGKLLGIS